MLIGLGRLLLLALPKLCVEYDDEDDAVGVCVALGSS
jgi:hypothetical protein